MKHIIIAVTLLLSSICFAENRIGFDVDSIVLYQPDESLNERIGPVDKLAKYEKKIEKICEYYYNGVNIPGSIDIVVAIRPGYRSKIWMTNISNSYVDINNIKKELENITPPRVVVGPVVFAIRGKIAGGTPKDVNNHMPIPEEWQESFVKNPINKPLPENPLDFIWPENIEDKSVVIPKGYVSQKLELTGGIIAKPIGWYYKENIMPSGVLWTLSKEDIAKGEYKTGLRIQLIVKVKKNSKETPEEVVNKFFSEKIKNVNVLNKCNQAASVPKSFNRGCLEVEEKLKYNGVYKLYHIVYSSFWSNELDVVLFKTFGAPIEDWEDVSDIADVMSDFKLYDK